MAQPGCRRTKSSIQRSKGPSLLWRPEPAGPPFGGGGPGPPPVFSDRTCKEACMYLLAWILVGAVVGWGAGRVFQGNGYGPFMDILMGVGGAVVGGFLIRTAGVGRYTGVIVTTMVAVIGAALVTVLTAYVNGRRIYARQL